MPEILAAVPAGARRARTQREFLRALARDELLAQLRTDRQRNIRTVGRILARHASWRDRTTRPTRALVCALAGISLSTWKAVRRWLESRGWLGTVRAGRAAWLRPGVLVDDQTPNDAAIYVLCVPASARPAPRTPAVTAGQDKTRPLTPPRSGGVEVPAREQHAGPVETPKTRSDEPRSPLAAVRRLRRQLGELARGPARRLADRHLLAIGRPMLAAGWSPPDLAFAVGHDPSSGRYEYSTSGVAEPGHWLAWRLSRWMRDPAGTWAGYRRLGRWDWSGDPSTWPLPAQSPSVRRAAAASADARRRQELLEPRPGASAPSAEYRKMRAQFARNPRRETG